MRDQLNYFNYFTEIEDTFVRRRGRHLFLSPLDWAMMETWQERGIPLHIVIRSIESVFDARERKPQPVRTIKTLFYCREEVEQQYAEWSASQVGASSLPESKEFGYDTESVNEHLASSIDKLRAIDRDDLREAIDRAVARLVELSDLDVTDQEVLDSSLSDIERMLEIAMVEDWRPDELVAIRKELEGELREYKREMSADAYANTFSLMLNKRLREAAGIPRLGLFFI